jgi:hypothetical protein
MCCVGFRTDAGKPHVARRASVSPQSTTVCSFADSPRGVVIRTRDPESKDYRETRISFFRLFDYSLTRLELRVGVGVSPCFFMVEFSMARRNFAMRIETSSTSSRTLGFHVLSEIGRLHTKFSSGHVVVYFQLMEPYTSRQSLLTHAVYIQPYRANCQRIYWRKREQGQGASRLPNSLMASKPRNGRL